MASYMYNPSKKVTDLLSKYLEFDPKTLELGIWSGDLSLKNVHLKREAIKPLLNNNNTNHSNTNNNTTNAFDFQNMENNIHDMMDAGAGVDPLTKNPLRVKLVRGTIGLLRIGIPWKQLVWGQGSVELELSEVTIVLSLQSRKETANEMAQEEAEEKRLRKDHDEEDDDDNDDGYDDGDNNEDDDSENNNSDTDDGDEFRRRKQQQQQRRKRRRKKDGHTKIYHRAYREAKQRKIREAERKQLNDMPVALWLEQLHQKRTIAKEAHRVEEQANKKKQQQQQEQAAGIAGVYRRSSSRSRRNSRETVATAATVKEGRFDRYMKSFSSDLFWRFFGGLKGSITKARIVLLQDGIEVGCIVQTIEVGIDKDGILSSIEIKKKHENNSSKSSAVAAAVATADTNSGTISSSKSQLQQSSSKGRGGGGVTSNAASSTMQQQQSQSSPHFYAEGEEYKGGAYDDGEHVDKILKQTGLGIFVRKEIDRKELKQIPSELKFSSSVVADDYILRPVTKLDVLFSLFYPHPPEKRRKQLQKLNTTTTSKQATTKNEKDDSTPTTAPTQQTDHTTRSSIVSQHQPQQCRRGKRDKRSNNDYNYNDDDINNNNDTGIGAPVLRRDRLRPRSSSHDTFDFKDYPLTPMKGSDTSNGNRNTGFDRRHPAQRFRTPLRSNSSDAISLLPLRESVASLTSSVEAEDENASTIADLPVRDLYSSSIVLDKPTVPCPRLQCRVNVDDINVVFTTRHYELLNYLFATVKRMKNGRPDRTIRDVKETEPGTELRQLLIEKRKLRQKQLGDDSNNNNDNTRTKNHNTTNSTSILSSWWTVSDNGGATTASKTNEIGLPLVSSASLPQTDDLSISEAYDDCDSIHYPTYYNGMVLKSARQEVIVQWWKYAFGVIKWEIRKRKHMTSMFRDMYISFDWKKQRHRRKEYIDLYIRYKLDSSMALRSTAQTRASSGMTMHIFSTDRDNFNRNKSFSKELKDAEETLSEIEEELPIEQILLYRSIARSMRVRRTTSEKMMTSSVLELWGKNGLTSAEDTRRQRLRRTSSITHGSGISRYTSVPIPEGGRKKEETKGKGVKFGSDTAFEKKSTFNKTSTFVDDDDENDPSLLSLVQNQFEVSQRLREKGGVQKYFEIGDDADGFEDKSNESVHNFNDDISNCNAAQYTSKNNFSKVGPFISAGQFYTSGGTSRDFATIGDGRTVRSKLSQYSKFRGSSMAGDTTIATRTTNVDNRMRLFFSFQIEKFNLIVIEEKYSFDLSSKMGPMTPTEQGLGSDSIGQADSSSVGDDMSDLSDLTDDKRFFSNTHDVENGEIGTIIEEEVDVDGVGAKMRSSDFLKFGQPQNTLLRLTISSLSMSTKGISGGGVQLGLSIARIEAVGEQEEHIISVGMDDRPVSEVNIDESPVAFERKQELTIDAGSSVDVSTMKSEKYQIMTEAIVFTRTPTVTPRNAVSLKFSKEGPSKTIQCDLSKINIIFDLVSAAKLVHFYDGPAVIHPSTLLAKTSRDIARKIMVKKIAHAPTKSLSAITSAIRVHGIEVRVPFYFNNESDSEDSELDSSFLFSQDSDGIIPKSQDKQLKYSLYLKSDDIELYSGYAIDELIQSSSMTMEGKDFSVASNSVSRSKNKSVVKSLKMLNVAELIGTHDSFSSEHFILTMGGIRFGLDAKTAGIVPSLMDLPVNVEVLFTSNDTSLLDTENPKQQMIVEISPIEFLLSKDRLDLLTAAKPAFDVSRKLNARSRKVIKRIKPDPPRIEILSHRILNSIDIKCRRMRIELVKDEPIVEALLPANMKEIIMEETLSDFLSVVACFDFALPNEEALSSAMQACIGRLVGLGLNDDEAWICTNRARLNFLDGITIMRKTQSNFFLQMSKSAEEEHYSCNDDNDVESPSFLFGNEDSAPYSSRSSIYSDDFSDDDSNNSARIVEATIKNAVEKTVSSFPTLLKGFFEETERLDDSIFLFVDLPMGFSISKLNMFYDQMITSLVPSLVITNKAGIEIITLLPHMKSNSIGVIDAVGNPRLSNNGLSFSRFNLDTNISFGHGGLPMSILASDEGADNDLSFRKRSRLDDIEVGELEFFFSSGLLEDIIDEITELVPEKYSDMDDDALIDNVGGTGKKNGIEIKHDLAIPPPIESSNVMIFSCVSFLFTTDELVPFSRATFEGLCYKNEQAMESLDMTETPSFAVVAKSFALMNLTPEGQFYPNALIPLIPPDELSNFPFQARYYASSDPWKISNRLEIDFTSFRFFLVRQFVNDLLQYFCYDHFGAGRLKNKYEKSTVDIHGNSAPPLLYSVFIYDSSIIIPKNSTSSDILALEIEDACISVSYNKTTFAMPTKMSPFDANPTSQAVDDIPNESMARTNSYVSMSDYEDCESNFSDALSDTGPVSSYTQDMIRRFTIRLDKFQVFTAIAKDKATSDLISSSLFRWIHDINGRAGASKSVYVEDIDKNMNDENKTMNFASFIHLWEEISVNALSIEILADSAPHSRLLISSRNDSMPFSLNARLSQICLLFAAWDSNMQELGTMCPTSMDDVFDSARQPGIPDNFPEYCSESFVSYLENIKESIRSEICCIFKEIKIRCTYDPPGYFSINPNCFQYFEDPGCADDVKPGLILALNDAVVHVINNHLNVKSIGMGASSIDLSDERRAGSFQDVISSDPVSNHKSWADLEWGLREDVETLESSSLPQPFQASVFMTSEFCLTNVGIQRADMVMHDLSWVWVLLDYFKSYFSDPEFGNPGFDAQLLSHKIKNSLRKSQNKDTLSFIPLPGIHVDFRLWLSKPVLCLPSKYFDMHAPSLILSSDTGLWYRYKSIQDFSAQEVVTTDLNLSFADEFLAPEKFRRDTMNNGLSSIVGLRPLVQGLSFGLRYDSNNKYDHKDVSVVIPFSSTAKGDDIPSCSIVGRELEIDPIVVVPPKLLKPFCKATRQFGITSCDVTCIIEVYPMVKDTMVNFFSGPSDVNNNFAPHEVDQPSQTFSISAKVGDVRIFLIDPDLGVQLPIAVLSLSSLSLTMSKFAAKPVAKYLIEGESQPSDLQIHLSSHFWIDYFKLGLTRSWEPFMEPFEFQILYESSNKRGQGYSFATDYPLSFNFSGALLSLLSESIDSFRAVIDETFGEKSNSNRDLNLHRRSLSHMPIEESRGAMVSEETRDVDGNGMEVIHEIPKKLKLSDRVAFSLRNLSGQRMRIHQQQSSSKDDGKNKPVLVTYLNQGENIPLTFDATISVVKNLRVSEVPYPGFSNSNSKIDRNEGSLYHSIDLQIPGCIWISNVRVDTFGRTFKNLIPRSPHVLSKVKNDWRLQNAMSLLAEVGPDNGGRLLSLISLFEVRNNTNHTVKLAFHPDPSHKPDLPSRNKAEESTDKINDSRISVINDLNAKKESDCVLINPNSSFYLPTLLLLSALEKVGSGTHLGSFWLSPDTTNTEEFSFRDFSNTLDAKAEEFDAKFSSKPVQLAKVVDETSLIYKNSNGEDIGIDDAKSGVQVSCSTHSGSEKIRTPFCYIIEIGRSPIVKAKVNDTGSDLSFKALVDDTERKAKKSTLSQKYVHGPVHYTFDIHPPIVICNLLPNGGRFELMHAVKKEVVWYADLRPGEQVSIHSLGLDVPLLLLVNLGFCRTPVGEGALVHHGGDSVEYREQNVGLKLIGKAVSKGTKKIGKTLTTLADSPDKRAQQRVAKMATPKAKGKRGKRRNLITKRLSNNDSGSLGLDIGGAGTETGSGKVHAIEAITYSTSDIANKTTVVDGAGQRLNLHIENIRGGGGQRRVSLYCPYWIVNTTEHALRYRESKEKKYVSGTVNSPEIDGSMPVDGSNQHYRSRHEMQSKRRVALSSSSFLSRNASALDNLPINPGTIFSGTHGGLATSPGRCTLSPENVAALIDQDMPIHQLAEMAFMFNFYEDGLGVEKLIVQLYDGYICNLNYVSGWSTGFGLDTVGISQVIRIPCKDGRMLELSATITSAPGFLTGYTKIVRFCPRYAIYNRLDRPIRLWQDSSIARPLSEDRKLNMTDMTGEPSESRTWRYEFEDKQKHEKNTISQYESVFGKSATINDRLTIRQGQLESKKLQIIPEGTTAFRSALYISTVGKSELVPFFLPDTRSASQLRVDLGGQWNLSSSFSSVVPGEHVLPMSRATDLSMLKHVSTRASPKYKVKLPPSDAGDWDGELGAYFETEWVGKGDRKILVKGTKRGKYAFDFTDMHVGDELLRINGISVLKMSFTEAMKTIKDRLTEICDYRERMKQKESGAEVVRNTQRVLRRFSLGGAKVPDTREGNVFKKLGGRKKTPVAKESIKPVYLTLSFRTQEERLRKLRVKAIETKRSSFFRTSSPKNDSISMDLDPIDALTVETKTLHNTIVVIVRHDDKDNPPYKIQNRSLKYFLFFRQRNCEDHDWKVLLPGESTSYTWAEPMKTKKLTVRIAADAFCPSRDNNKDDKSFTESVFSESENSVYLTTEDKIANAIRADRLKQILSYQYVENEERGGFGPPTTVKIEEIGFQCLLSAPSFIEALEEEKYLHCEVDTDGATRLLIVSDIAGDSDDRKTIKRNIKSLHKQISHEEERSRGLQTLRRELTLSVEKEKWVEDLGYDSYDPTEMKRKAHEIEDELNVFCDDFPEGNITKRYQVIVQVLEAVGLSQTDLRGSPSPYCEVFSKGRSRSRKNFLQKRTNKRKTYFVEKSLRPRWNDQYFVFDVPEEAIQTTRGFSIQIIIRDFRSVGQHPVLGQASMHFASVLNQEELVGWWPLVGRYGNTDTTDAVADAVSDFGRGSIKLRAQWIYTLDALIDYYELLSERRLLALTKTEKGMQDQLKYANESFQRKREAMDRHPKGRIAKLIKLQKKAVVNKEAAIKRVERKDVSTSSAKTNSSAAPNINFCQLQSSLKVSRQQSVHALTFQTEESKRRRHSNVEFNTILEESAILSKGSRLSRISTSSTISIDKELKDRVSPINRSRTNSLGDYFARVQSHRYRSSDPSLLTSHRKLSLDLDDPTFKGVISEMDQSSHHQLSVLMEKAELSASRATFDLSGTRNTSSTERQELARKRNDVARLMRFGFVFHKLGSYFHENHLPNHFRRLIFATSPGQKKSESLYSGKSFVGTSSSIKRFKNWNCPQTLLCDPEINVVVAGGIFSIRLDDGNKNNVSVCTEKSLLSETNTQLISQKLKVPTKAPRVTIERSRYRIEMMQLSRTAFDRSCKRLLSCVLNSGGWISIRPIAAMNLPDSYNGMFVKAAYGSEVSSSETVDAKVSPRWPSTTTGDSSTPKRNRTRRPKVPAGPVMAAAAAGFEFSENDLLIRTEPHQTGGSIVVTVVAERFKKQFELGVVHIPIGAAIATCIDAAQDMEQSTTNGTSFLNDIPMYTRWLPLIDPKSTVPVAGDMGLSSRPQEHEQLRDNMFCNYFSPCIQLSLIWWPDGEIDGVDNGETESFDGKQSTKDLFERKSQSIVSHILRTPPIQSYSNIDINAISVALIDSSHTKELLNLTMMEIDIKHSVTKTKTSTGFAIGLIQVDQQDDKSNEPVVFAPTPSAYKRPTLQFLALKDNLRTKLNIVSYEHIGIVIEEMDLTVEEPRVYELWDFYIGVNRRRKLKIQAVRGQQRADILRNSNIFTAIEIDDEIESKHSLLSLIQSAGDRGPLSKQKKVYVEQLVLGLVKINLSYVKGRKSNFDALESGFNALDNGFNTLGDSQSDANATDHSEVYTRWSQLADDDNTLESGASHNLPGIIASVFPSVSDAPIRLQAKLIQHIFESPVEIVSSMKTYYTTETIKQIYRIIGSLDFVGNPTLLLTSFMSGVKDLVSAPTAALIRNPTDVRQVGIGVGKGTLSFVSHSASGFFGLTARLFSQAGQATAFFSFDPDFKQWHQERIVNEATNLERVWKRRGIQNLGEMILRPVSDVLFGFTLGVAGVVTSPYRGARKAGTRGFVRGTGVGLAGLITKPVVGVFDALTHGSQSVHDIAKTVNFMEQRFQPVQKLRLPYVFGYMKILQPYDAVAARSIFLLAMFPPKTKLKRRLNKGQEFHIHSEVLLMEPGVETFAIASSIRIVIINLRRDANNSLAPTFGWEVGISSAAKVSSRISDHGHNGVAITITKCNDCSGSKNVVNYRRKASETTAPLSAFSFHSESLSEGDEEDEYDEEFNTTNLGQNFSSVNLDSSYKSAPNYLGDSVKAGVTMKGNKTLEWFTVLAEYQLRKQLTRFHNAICCVLGDYDAVITDRIYTSNDTENNSEGIMTFGIYNFERGLPDGKRAQASNKRVIASLENMPWMAQDLVLRISGFSSLARQQRAMEKVRQVWNYSNEIKASRHAGGPDWLVEARAKAMLVTRNILDHSDDNKDCINQYGSSSPMHEANTEFGRDSSNSTRKDDTGSSCSGIDLQSHSRAKNRIAIHHASGFNTSSTTEVIDASNQTKSSGISDGASMSTSKKSSSEEPLEVRIAIQRDDAFSASSAEAVDASKESSSSSDSDEASQLDLSKNLSVISESGVSSSFPMEATLARSNLEQNSLPKSTYHVKMGRDGDDIDRDCDYNRLVEDFHSPINGKMDDNGHVEIFASNRLPVLEQNQQRQYWQHQNPPVSSLYVPDSSLHEKSSRSKNNASGLTSPSVDLRIDRLEGVMEQLVLLNAAQAQRNFAADAKTALVTATQHDRSHHSSTQNTSVSSVHEIADTLKQELQEIRGKMEQRAEDDVALRQEINLLRNQLARKRSVRSPTAEASAATARSNSASFGDNTKTDNYNAHRRLRNPIRELFGYRKNNRYKKQQQLPHEGSAKDNKDGDINCNE